MIRQIVRGFWLLVQMAESVLALLGHMLFLRPFALVLAHHPDIDRRGVDVQMGPLLSLLEARRIRYVLVTFVRLDRSTITDVRRRRRLGITHASLLAAARVLMSLRPRKHPRSEDGRRAIARALLLALSPKVLFLIDESGSGQPFVTAGRDLGIPSIGIQHGAFQQTNRQYAPEPGKPFSVAPADRLCVWSEWFKQRLLEISPLYDATNAVVTGRLHRRALERTRRRPDGQLRMLYLSQGDPAFEREALPFLERICEEGAGDLKIKSHPGEADGGPLERLLPRASRWTEGLEAGLDWADVAIGIGTTAILDAVDAGVPALGLVTESYKDPAGYVRAGIVTPCDSPLVVSETCRKASQLDPKVLEERRRLVFGEEGSDAGASILSLGFDLVRRTPIPRV